MHSHQVWWRSDQRFPGPMACDVTSGLVTSSAIGLGFVRDVLLASHQVWWRSDQRFWIANRQTDRQTQAAYNIDQKNTRLRPGPGRTTCSRCAGTTRLALRARRHFRFSNVIPDSLRTLPGCHSRSTPNQVTIGPLSRFALARQQAQVSSEMFFQLPTKFGGARASRSQLALRTRSAIGAGFVRDVLLASHQVWWRSDQRFWRESRTDTQTDTHTHTHTDASGL